MATFTGLSLNQKLKIFQICSLIRHVETEISTRYSSGKMRCPVHLSIGQEGVPAALSLLLNKKDFAVSTHRAHAHYISKGGSIKRMIAEIYGKSTGCSGGRGGSMHLTDKKKGFMGSSSIVGNSIPLGVGLGLSLKLKKSKNLSIIYLGDGAVETGAFFESINFSILKKLPVIFICENNLYSVYTSIKDRQPKNRKIYKMVSGLGIKSHYFDGSKPFSFFKKLEKIVKQTRQKSEPCFIEFSTYRYLEHCGPFNDDNLRYRPKKELDKWNKKDPYINLKSILEKNIKLKNRIKDIEKKNIKTVNSAFLFAEKSKFPTKRDLEKNVYKKK
ncbi:thiamine pyrophosphate-dependent dehydrogenase E1 component subunit alpha [Candidatus Pelagibacter ubique]|nr:thiamine pyrophosphate-dependent dehydrogenase E1 component subunit alpha [Candidatus Pelagibacter ubique]|tara:strand:+ start:823 stop:1809 length:987 start_codon:yes stop_codon:yes gene_type:complete